MSEALNTQSHWHDRPAVRRKDCTIVFASASASALVPFDVALTVTVCCRLYFRAISLPRHPTATKDTMCLDSSSRDPANLRRYQTIAGIGRVSSMHFEP
eukprot:1190390-Prorocentrum_minimum.AAC.2